MCEDLGQASLELKLHALRTRPLLQNPFCCRNAGRAATRQWERGQDTNLQASDEGKHKGLCPGACSLCKVIKHLKLMGSK